MCDVPPPGMPKIDTEDFELWLCGESSELLELFKSNRDAFEQLLYRLIRELKLENHIQELHVCGPHQNRAHLYRERVNPWPSGILNLDLYLESYMDECLLRHELQHEADRRNPEMLYDPEIECRWKKSDALEVAANISVDARLGEGGLDKECRWRDFSGYVGADSRPLFEELWANPPRTWPAIEVLARRLAMMRRGVQELE